MLCSSCKTAEATVFLVDGLDAVEGEAGERLLCEECAKDYFEIAEQGASPWTRTPTFDEVVDILTRYNQKFKAEAYHFVRAGLDHSSKARKPPGHTGEFHVSASELLDDLAALAKERFGFRARETLASWGVTCCDDFGTVVYDLIETGSFKAGEHDERTDFYPGYDFASKFPSR